MHIAKLHDGFLSIVVLYRPSKITAWQIAVKNTMQKTSLLALDCCLEASFVNKSKMAAVTCVKLLF